MSPLATLEPLPYHRALREHLATRHPEVWAWFSSSDFRAESTAAVRLELLKSTYRLDREAHPELHARADQARAALGLDVPVALYQSQADDGPLNAFIAILGDEAHVVFCGPVLERLSPSETVALLGHELAHFALLAGWGGGYRVVQEIVRAMANDARATPGHHESDRFLRLFTEIFCDRGALLAAGELETAVSMLVKLHTGLAEVSAESYLRQSDEILAHGLMGSDGLSHPEAYLRAAVLRLWREQGAAAEERIRDLVVGEPVLDRLDLLAQVRWSELTRRLLTLYLAPPALRSEALLAHARHFFEDFEPPAATEPAEAYRDDALATELRVADPGLGDYLSYLLLDFVALAEELGDLALAAAFVLLEPVGLGDRLAEIAKRELGRDPKGLAKIRAAAAELLVAEGWR